MNAAATTASVVAFKKIRRVPCASHAFNNTLKALIRENCLKYLWDSVVFMMEQVWKANRLVRPTLFSGNDSTSCRRIILSLPYMERRMELLLLSYHHNWNVMHRGRPRCCSGSKAPDDSPNRRDRQPSRGVWRVWGPQESRGWCEQEKKDDEDLQAAVSLWRTLVQQLDGDDPLLLSFRGPDLLERRVPEEQVPED